ncbi:hypothetical protein Scep_011628 [Stephania cephalantha]|uniref:Bulb-type lectin domain-containing protein n=1 Tax=Stephania cephalantha TaxID=152367 RepID=A0AAP0P8J4_9MAGN
MAHPFFSILLTIIIFSSFAHADVPPSQTFKYINQGEFGEYITEYGADYRLLDIYAFPFQLCFYNTTPNAFTLGLRMGHRRSESLLRWVWAANRNNPVRENATLTFGRDGNLVLADANGRLAWQTNTANKGVVGLKLLNNGNLVLYDAQNQFVWQSFDYPTDTLLVGQEFRRPNGPLKIVSRVSDIDGSEGPYSLVMEKNRLALYLKPINRSKPILYYSTDKDFGEMSSTLSRVVFNTAPETDEAYAYEIRYELIPRGSSPGVSTMILGRPKYNSTLSLLRLGSDGNLKVYTYYDKVDWGAWETTYTLFDRDSRVSECRLPSKCGALGVCNEEQCVGCPTPQGLVAWDKSTCGVPKLGSCNSTTKFGYIKVVGVEHFMNWFSEGEGPVKVEECKAKCDKDCGCLGYFYREESSKCLLASVLGTLIKVPIPAHVAYIKTLN